VESSCDFPLCWPYNQPFALDSLLEQPALNTANFRSDNETAVAPQIWQALEEANVGTAYSYGEDDWSLKLDEAFSELFETETLVLPVSTGTIANAIALATVTPPWGMVFCHRSAHIAIDEAGAPEFLGNGLRLVQVDGHYGKIQADGFTASLESAVGHGVHSYEPSSLSLTQCTDFGTSYSCDEIQSVCSIAADRKMATHMDGSRLANAIVNQGCSPAECTWKAGVQMLSFGASKNGCMAAEALLFFGEEGRYGIAERHRKRSGHLLSKMRYVSAQLLAYIQDDLWLKLASNANDQAARFAAIIEAHPEAQLEFPVGGNEVFVHWAPAKIERLKESGVQFQLWPGRDDLARFVFSYSTTPEETDQLINAFSG
jgi:threonine aldolase